MEFEARYIEGWTDTYSATDRLGSVVYKFGMGLAVQNGTFESGVVAPWAPYGEAQISISNVSRTGGHSMRLTTTVSDHGAYQDVKGLVAGMSYQFRAWVRSETGLVNGSLAVSDTVGNNIAWTGVQSISNTWREFLVTFTATSQGIARIHLVKWDTTGALLWDDVELVNGATATSGLKMRYYPYGQEVGTATANDVAKFGTYTRDSGSGLDYAMNRYYQSWWGRFTTADPYRASGGPGDPGSWNRYAYVQGDPVNYFDPAGLQMASPSSCHWSPLMVAGIEGWSFSGLQGYVCEEVGGMVWGGGGGTRKAQFVPLDERLDSKLQNDLANLPGWLLGSRIANDDCNKNVLSPLAKSLGFDLDRFVSFLHYGGTFYDGTKSTATVAGNVTSAAAATARYGAGATVDSVFRGGGTNALTSITTTTFTAYIKPSAVSTGGGVGNMGLLFHEALHGFGGILGGTSYFDTDIQGALFGEKSPEVGKPSVNITNFIKDNCFK